MAAPLIFICHAQPDAAFARDLGLALETFRLPVWSDSRNLRGDNRLAPEVRWAIEQARHVIVVLSLNTGDPTWLRREIEIAQEVERRRAERYRVIPLLLPGVEPAILPQWFTPIPRTTPLQIPLDGLGSILPTLLSALGESSSAGNVNERHAQQPTELELHFSQHASPGPAWQWTARLNPHSEATNPPQTVRGSLPTAPARALQHWYLQTYPCWPTDVMRALADHTAAQLVEWGRLLYRIILEAPESLAITTQWHDLLSSQEGRLVVKIDPDHPATAELLDLPWELLHDASDFLIRGKQPVQIIRRFPGGGDAFLPVPPPLRILAISPRPDTEPTGHADYRRSTLPLLEALVSLGGLVETQRLASPTLAALEKQLNEAWATGRPLAILHLDAYLRQDPATQEVLCAFETRYDPPAPVCREAHFVPIKDLVALLSSYRIRLVVLYTGNTSSADSAAVSLTSLLLANGIAAVIHVHPAAPIETQERFWRAFYEELLRGARISQALFAGQNRLAGDTYRLAGMSSSVHLQDWFCFRLYVGEQDPRLCLRPPLDLRRRLLELTWPGPPAHLPALPATGFLGRARDLLRLERLLEEESNLFLRGAGGSGKTATATALAHWLARSGRFHQIAYLNRDDAREPSHLLETLGRQLMPQTKHWSVETYPTFWRALSHLQKTLGKQPTLIVLDQIERWPSEHDKLFDQLWQDLLNGCRGLRLLGLGRLGPPSFAQPWKELKLSPLDGGDAIRLIGRTLIGAREIPPASDSQDGFQPIRELVKLAGGHPVALQRISHEIAVQGAKATLALLHALRAEILYRHPDDPQWPLFLGTELTLRQLPEEDRERSALIAFFKGGMNRIALGKALAFDTQDLDAFQKRLTALDLIEDQGYGHWRFDPALSHYLANQLSPSHRLIWQERWRNGMEELIDVLYQQYFKDNTRTLRLLRLELPNLLTFLRDHQQHFSAERTARLASRLEQLLASLGIPNALGEAMAARERAGHALSGWSRIRFETERLRVERLRDNGSLEEAFQAARQLLRQCQEAGPDSYPGAGYDLAQAYFQLGKLLKLTGAAESAVREFSVARRQFKALAEAGNGNAGRMAAVVDAEIGDCLTYLQRLQEAANAYEAALTQSGPNAPKGLIATNKMQLGLVRQRQGQYSEAVDLYDSARRIFEALGEPEGTARAWKQIALSHKLNGDIKQALHACQQALYLYEQQRDRSGVTETLGELGHLHQIANQLEEAALAYRRLAELCAQLGDSLGEEAGRNKLANVLIQLHRHDEARQELYRASECNLPDSYTARNWAIRRGLHDLGQSAQNPDVADRARRQAMQKYLAYRRAGGENDNPGARLCAQVHQAIRTGETASLAVKLEQISASSNVPPGGKLLIDKLKAILMGSYDPGLATDPNLHYQYAVELQLLLEALVRR